MIYDKLCNIENYKGQNKNLDTVIQFIQENDYTLLPIGKTIINDEVFVNVFEYEIDENTLSPFEYHKLYGDVHLVGKNQENINSTPVGNVEITTPYDEGSDAGLGNATAYDTYLVDHEHFYVAYPEDAHRVKVYAGKKDIRKIVFKFKLV